MRKPASYTAGGSDRKSLVVVWWNCRKVRKIVSMLKINLQLSVFHVLIHRR